ncbi:zinc-dependent alcohol dehydrogenase [Pseudonocardia oroxyli]|uniref:Threonine dehydrogenase n=1 Tax=Pseudonocardia oroxyli TaxID=366584 RepID=A0A1G7VUY7_PSEOR|nr:zinc-binding alcohol dehydrogenase [Pseudonocardia oroxyli]SDG63219.1 Threonine dehydrogenase [Pseudonocardia oroxyli]
MRALWTTPGAAALVEGPDPVPGPGEVLVRTLHSGISRGTEALVFRGGVPATQAAEMRAPFQEGEFPGPVKYGYLNVGRTAAGEVVFCLYPHQDVYAVPPSALVPVPDDVPAARAVLAGTVETAVNALWDAGPRVGDRIAVVGAGMVGCCVAALLSDIPGVRVQVVDPRDRSAVLAPWGVSCVDDPAEDCDLVFHTSGTSAGLQRSLDLLGVEGSVIELSWYGDAPVSVQLGGAFHPRRLTVRSSQVGMVAGARRARWGYADRMALALRLLADPRFDAVITDAVPFSALAERLPGILGEPSGLCVRVDY